MRAETIEEVLIELHAGQWFSWTDSKNKVYENLILAEKIWDVSYTGKKHFEGLIGNPYELPTKEFLESELKKMQDEYDVQKYARNRKEEYPPMEEQLDYMFHNGFDKWKEDIVQPVKDKYPKPE